MGDVVSVPSWGRRPNIDGLDAKFCSCNEFIRSKVAIPPIGRIVIDVQGAQILLTGDTTTIIGKDCEVSIRRNTVFMTGCRDNAAAIFCEINLEIEEIAGKSP